MMQKEKRAKNFLQKVRRDLMACYTLPLKKAKNKGNVLTVNVEFRDGMGVRMGNGLFLCYFERWSMTGHY